MRVRTFGLTEAKRANEFAKTDDQRKTVLAVARMFDIPIVIEREAVKRVANMDSAIKNNDTKIDRLQEKVSNLRAVRGENIATKSEATELSREWFFE